MRVLILWRRGTIYIRNTILDHAFCFRKYDKENEYFYFDVFNGRFQEDYSWINEKMFDVVIFHYSALSLRGREIYWDDFVNLMVPVWRDYPCKKILLPQDDYTSTERIWDFANGIRADIIYTVIRECDYDVLYPKCKVGNIKIKTILTGYVEEAYLKKQALLKCILTKHEDRKNDIVYRARKLPYSHGKHGQLKYELVLLFNEHLKNSGLSYDLGNTNDDKNAILGDDWLFFLASSRVTIGCLGGAGFADITGEYARKARDYAKLHKGITYETTKKACFSDIEENLTGIVSPRIFDAAITRTCQVLVGTDYQGIMRPNIDYILLNEDFSNIDEVMLKIKDIGYCEQIADNCYEHVVKSQRYTYRKFVRWIMDDIGKTNLEKDTSDTLSDYIEAMCKKNNDCVINEILMKEKK